LTENASGHFECRWVHLAANPLATASFLAALDEPIFCPVAHGEGNFQVKDNATLADLETRRLIAFRYVDAAGGSVDGDYPANPNGSVDDIAGVCNERGNVVGLMPHPEDHIAPIQNPLQQRKGPGLPLFQAIIGSIRA
jgi:phosphoribosylformylglycinamidine synthase